MFHRIIAEVWDPDQCVRELSTPVYHLQMLHSIVNECAAQSMNLSAGNFNRHYTLEKLSLAAVELRNFRRVYNASMLYSGALDELNSVSNFDMVGHIRSVFDGETMLTLEDFLNEVEKNLPLSLTPMGRRRDEDKFFGEGIVSRNAMDDTRLHYTKLLDMRHLCISLRVHLQRENIDIAHLSSNAYKGTGGDWSMGTSFRSNVERGEVDAMLWLDCVADRAARKVFKNEGTMAQFTLDLSLACDCAKEEVSNIRNRRFNVLLMGLNVAVFFSSLSEFYETPEKAWSNLLGLYVLMQLYPLSSTAVSGAVGILWLFSLRK